MRTLSTESSGGSLLPMDKSVSDRPLHKRRGTSPLPSFDTLHALANQAGRGSSEDAVPVLDKESGSALLRAIQAGDRQALAKLYTIYAPALRSAALLLLGDPAQAEDLLHDVFFEAWRCAESYDETRSRVWTWLLIRLRSRAIDHLRRATHRRRQKRRARQPMRSCETFSDSPEGRYLTIALSRDLARLPVAQQRLLNLAYSQELSHQEIAEELGYPIGTVKSRLRRLLRSLCKGPGTRPLPAPALR